MRDQWEGASATAVSSSHVTNSITLKKIVAASNERTIRASGRQSNSMEVKRRSAEAQELKPDLPSIENKHHKVGRRR